jgi:hypothetical protein
MERRNTIIDLIEENKQENSDRKSNRIRTLTEKNKMGKQVTNNGKEARDKNDDGRGEKEGTGE